MSIGRLLLILIILALAFWLLTSSGLLAPKPSPAPTSSPIDRARAAARKSEERNTQAEGLKREADSASPSSAVTENMTPDQVRALLGAPDDVVSETSDSGSPREKWTYRSVGKTVIFENGVVVRIQ